jgi:hypothetical protein
MRRAAQQVSVEEATLGQQGRPWDGRVVAWQRLTDNRRALLLAMYEKVMVLHAQGNTRKSIARELGIDQRTVRIFIVSGSFPERACCRRLKTDPLGELGDAALTLCLLRHATSHADWLHIDGVVDY